MPKRRQQYRRPPRPLPIRTDGSSEESLQLAAVRLAASETVDSLRLLIKQNRERVELADQRAHEQPGSEALYHFREATLHLAEAERALKLAETSALADPVAPHEVAPGSAQR